MTVLETFQRFQIKEETMSSISLLLLILTVCLNLWLKKHCIPSFLPRKHSYLLLAVQKRIKTHNLHNKRRSIKKLFWEENTLSKKKGCFEKKRVSCNRKVASSRPA